MIHHGDLFDVLPRLQADSIDACVTDPPYGIAFMGKEWDNFRRSRNTADVGRDSVMGRLSRTAPASGAESDRLAFEAWTCSWASEVLRVLKPGAHIAVFGATRNYHRMACGIEDAGFEIRDCLCWLFGQGFPKSMNLGHGWGTALKPAYEPIVLARKPFTGIATACHAEHGTAGLNIDACRIGTTDDRSRPPRSQNKIYGGGNGTNLTAFDSNPLGRWPANVLLDEQAAALLDQANYTYRRDRA